MYHKFRVLLVKSGNDPFWKELIFVLGVKELVEPIWLTVKTIYYQAMCIVFQMKERLVNIVCSACCNNIFLLYFHTITFQTIHARGPNYTKISSVSCRNSFLTSTMHMPPKIPERRNMNYDQRSLYHKRDTSPMSICSVPDLKLSNYHHPYNKRGTGYQRSVYNGRSCSSVRSFGMFIR